MKYVNHIIGPAFVFVLTACNGEGPTLHPTDEQNNNGVTPQQASSIPIETTSLYSVTL